MKWKTQQGKIINIKEMTDSHLNNCIKLTEKRISEYLGESYYMGNSSEAEDAVEQENRYNKILLEDLNKTLKKLKIEQKRHNKGKTDFPY